MADDSDLLHRGLHLLRREHSVLLGRHPDGDRIRSSGVGQAAATALPEVIPPPLPTSRALPAPCESAGFRIYLSRLFWPEK